MFFSIIQNYFEIVEFLAIIMCLWIYVFHLN